MWNEIKNFFVSARRTTREEAKGRLHLVLAHDRAGIDGAKLQELRAEVAAVIRKYVEIDPEAVEIQIGGCPAGPQLTVHSTLPSARVKPGRTVNVDLDVEVEGTETTPPEVTSTGAELPGPGQPQRGWPRSCQFSKVNVNVKVSALQRSRRPPGRRHPRASGHAEEGAR